MTKTAGPSVAQGWSHKADKSSHQKFSSKKSKISMGKKTGGRKKGWRYVGLKKSCKLVLLKKLFKKNKDMLVKKKEKN